MLRRPVRRLLFAIYLDLFLANRVAHRLGALCALSADHDFLAHLGGLVDRWNLMRFTDFYRPLLERMVTDRSALSRPALDFDPFIAQIDLLLDRAFDDKAAHVNRSLYPCLADLNLLLGQRDGFVVLAVRGTHPLFP